MLRSNVWLILGLTCMFGVVGYILGRTNVLSTWGMVDLQSGGELADGRSGETMTNASGDSRIGRDNHYVDDRTNGDDGTYLEEDLSDHDEEFVIELSAEAYQNLGLRQQPLELDSYWKTLRVPAVVIEKPGHSSHSLAAPVHGVVRRILVVPGQAVSPGDALIELRVTDEQLAQSQLDLLQDVTRLEVITTELERLAPLIAEGSVPGSKRRELVYEEQQLMAKKALHEQELLLHGLTDEQVQTIITSKRLVRDFTVRLASHADQLIEDEQPSLTAVEGPAYTVERLSALQGAAVKRGDELCDLAYHAELYLQGQAFEDELERIRNAADQRWGITAQFGISNDVYERTDLSIEYIDNHVEQATRTFDFYVPIRNEVTRDHVNDRGVLFRTWRLKPGQRAYLQIPIERWEDQLVVPVQAVVEDGLDQFVFRKHVHEEHEDEVNDEATKDGRADAQSTSQEFERVPVHVVYRSISDAVINREGKLNPGDIVAINRAYELNLALKRQNESVGGHHHDHDH